MRPENNPLFFVELCCALPPDDLQTLAGRLRKRRATAKATRPVDEAVRLCVAVYYDKTGERLTFQSVRLMVYRLDETVPTFACETDDELTAFIETLPESPDNFIVFDQSVNRWKSLSLYFDPF